MFFKKIFKKVLLLNTNVGNKSSNFKLFNSFVRLFKKYIHQFFFFIKKYKFFLFCLFLAFLISDLLLIKSYHFLLIDKELPPLSIAASSSQDLFSKSYKSIWENNIFHTGSIPTQLEENIVFADPVLSSLPFKLKGTITHANPRLSVATISSGSENKTLSYQSGDLIEKQAEIKEILRAKVIFFNQNNNRLEYILILEDQSIKISYKQVKKKKPIDNSMVKRTGDNQFQVNRSDINEYLKKLPEILNQARVVLQRSEKNGKTQARFVSIDKNSVYQELGFEQGDVIKEVDGKPVPDTPDKALELLDQLQEGSGFKMLVEKNGQDVYYKYNVRENAPIR